MSEPGLDADLERQAKAIAGHTIRATFDSAKELEAGGDAATAALSKMVRIHRRAADLIETAALAAKLKQRTVRA